MLSTRAVLQRCISGLHEDARFRNRVLASVLAVAFLVGAFASGLEVQVRFGPGGASDQAALARSDPSAPPAPSGSGAGRSAAPTLSGPRAADGAGVEDLAPLTLDPAPGLPTLPPLPVPGPDDAPAAPGIEAPEVPPVPDLPGARPDAGSGFHDGDDGRCIVTDTVILVPLDPGLLPGEACEEVTGELDDARAPDVDVPDPPDPPDAPSGQAVGATAGGPGWLRALVAALQVRGA